jgi:hypothetical protein
MSKIFLRHTFTKKHPWHFWLLYLYTFSLYENASLIIFTAETEYTSTRYWYRNINFLRDRIRYYRRRYTVDYYNYYYGPAAWMQWYIYYYLYYVPVITVTITRVGDNNVVDITEGDIHTFISTTESRRTAAWIQWYNTYS